MAIRNRARKDFTKRTRSSKLLARNSSMVSHYVQTVARNKDYYNHIISRNCTMSKLVVISDIGELPSFVLRMHVYDKDSTYFKDFVIDKTGVIPFKIDENLIEGDRIRFDIQDIASVYEIITNMGISFMLDYKEV